MDASVSKQCRTCITTLKAIVSILFHPAKIEGRLRHEQVTDELERFSLWVGNIGALHRPESSMSLESRLHDAKDVLSHILELLGDLIEVTAELRKTTSGAREGEITFVSRDDDDEEEQNEESELLEESAACITRLFRVSSLIRQATPTDIFSKALSRNRYRFNDQFDIAHVGEKYPKLATQELAWLCKRLGHAITQRRHYLSYIQDHREKLEGLLDREETPGSGALKPQVPTNQLTAIKLSPDSFSRPSTFLTKASSLAPELITPKMLTVELESDPEEDTRSYTTISHTDDGDLESSTAVRIPRFDEVRIGFRKEVECPFCFRVERFKHERAWRRHVFSDLRSYVCTFPDCDAPSFGDINDWFRHEMQIHRVSYTCQLCQSTIFQAKERYLAHVRKRHPEMLQMGEEQSVLDIARKPLEQISPQDCPCCTDWVDRLKGRASVSSMPPEVPDQVISVTPNVFKRHLASHLEQLAQFAVPIPSAEGDFNSNVAVDIGDPVPATEELAPSNLDRQVMQWLSPPDASINYVHALRNRLEGTGQWFLNSSKFRNWMSGRGHELLWLRGSPGCGKTILSCSIIEHLEASRTSNSLVLYFFFDFSDESKQTFVDMMRSLIFQLCGSDEQTAPAVKQLYEECGKGKQDPSLTNVCGTFIKMLANFPKVFLVLDALDECITLDSLLTWLVLTSRTENIRIIVASRHTSQITLSIVDSTRPGNTLKLENGMTEDIRAYVQQSLEQSDNITLAEYLKHRPDLLRRTATIIVGKSDGIFLQAKLKVDALINSVSEKDILRTLEHVPYSSREVYDDILRKVMEEDLPGSIRLLQILRDEDRLLMIKEAADLLAEAPEKTPSSYSGRPMPELQKVVESCSNLVTMVEEGGYIRLAHISVKEYLTSKWGSELLDGLRVDY